MDVDELVEYEDDDMNAEPIKAPTGSQDAVMAYGDTSGVANGDGNGNGEAMMETDLLMEDRMDEDVPAVAVDAAEVIGGGEDVPMEGAEKEGLLVLEGARENEIPSARMSPVNETAAPSPIPIPLFDTTSQPLPPPIPIPNPDPTSASSSTWPPEPTAVPPVPSQVPTALSIPEEMKHEEGHVGSAGGSALNSIAAEAPGSPKKLVGEGEGEASNMAQEIKGDEVGESEVLEMGDGEGEASGQADATATVEAVETAEAIGAEVEGGIRDDAEITNIDTVEPAENARAGAVTAEAGEGLTDELVEAEEAHDDAMGEDDHTEDVAAVDGDGEEFLYDEEEHEHIEGHEDEHEYEHQDDIDSSSAPSIIIATSTTSHRPLFETLPSHLHYDFPSSDNNPTAGDGGIPLLPDMAQDLLTAPLRDLFVALRASLGDEWDEDRGNEMVLSIDALGLKLGEDNKHTDTLRLTDLVDIHSRCNCPEPMVLTVEHDSIRFISKYNAIKKVLDNAAGPPDIDSSSDEGEYDEGEGEGEEVYDEHLGEEGEYAGEGEEHGGAEEGGYEGEEQHYEDGEYHGEEQVEAYEGEDYEGEQEGHVDGDEFGVDAAVREAERAVEAEETKQTVVPTTTNGHTEIADEPPATAVQDSSSPKSPSTSLKRPLETDEPEERAVKRKLSDDAEAS